MTKCENKARELLIKQNITGFAIDVTKLQFNKTVIFDTFEGYAQAAGIPDLFSEKFKDGCTLIKGDIHIILTHEPHPQSFHRHSPKNRSCANRLNWTLAHEAGHVVLGHRWDGEREEREAHCFAAELLMPELILLELSNRLKRKLDIYEVSRLFNVSESASAARLAQFERKNLYSAYLRKELLKKYKDLIENYEQHCRNRRTPERGQINPF
ncbi:MAG: ImmA/IrrE family metallo-endopeptidase [Oscillospiraceae bacterium]|nr:ImmA/IrrE family metallo-endopeptidase [Oscillospiraceae bacterium]